MGGEFSGGFNSRIGGSSYLEEAGGRPFMGDRYFGWQSAEDMINKGEVYYRHKFQHEALGSICKDMSFGYGGTQVCDRCQRSRIEEPWWVVKVYKDGTAWCVVGEGFDNLQSSDNYAFGDSKGAALQNYQDKFLTAQTNERVEIALEG